MKAKQLAHLLDQVSTIFKQLPDMEVATALGVITQTLSNQTLISPSNLPEEHVASPVSAMLSAWSTTSAIAEGIQQDTLIHELEKTPTSELNAFLRSSKVWKRDALQKIAKHYGIHFNTKMNREQLLSLIMTHHETLRAHSQIRSYQVEHPHL